MTSREAPTAEAAQRFLDEAGFVWHQRFQLVPGVYTPGQNDLEWIFQVAVVPDDLSGMTALDIGTSNGARRSSSSAAAPGASSPSTSTPRAGSASTR